MSRCVFIEANGSQCPYDANDTSDYCNDHDGLECVRCGSQATHECGVTTHNLLCSAYLCDVCHATHVSEDHVAGEI